MRNYKPSGANPFNFKSLNKVYNMDKQNVQDRLQMTKMVISKGLQVVLLKLNLCPHFKSKEIQIQRYNYWETKIFPCTCLNDSIINYHGMKMKSPRLNAINKGLQEKS